MHLEGNTKSIHSVHSILFHKLGRRYIFFHLMSCSIPLLFFLVYLAFFYINKVFNL